MEPLSNHYLAVLCVPMSYSTVLGHDYGVCCAGEDKMQKPGVCPLRHGDNGEECGDECDDDYSCSGDMKCCQSSTCGGKHYCRRPANMTCEFLYYTHSPINGSLINLVFMGRNKIKGFSLGHFEGCVCGRTDWGP